MSSNVYRFFAQHFLADAEREFTQRCKNMHLFISGSAPLLTETFLERYGMSETGMNTSNPLEGERKAGTVGLPLPGVEVRVADERDQVVGTDVIGAIPVRGPNVFAGYWCRPELNDAEFTREGFPAPTTWASSTRTVTCRSWAARKILSSAAA